MRKINDIGKKLIEYKNELIKDYPDIVIDSLMLAIEKMVNNGDADLETYKRIEDRNEDIDHFISFLLTKEQYKKTFEELFQEYEVFRKKIAEELEMHGLLGLSTETIVEKDAIYVTKTFSIDENFVMEYFGVEEKDLITLMKRRGFVEQFVALRLSKILKDIKKEAEVYASLIKIDNSLAYFNEEKSGYNIDLIMVLPIDDLYDLENKTKVIVEIKEINALAEKKYNSKMIP